MQEEDEHEWSIFTELIQSQTILKGSTYLTSTCRGKKLKKNCGRGNAGYVHTYSIKKSWLRYFSVVRPTVFIVRTYIYYNKESGIIEFSFNSSSIIIPFSKIVIQKMSKMCKVITIRETHFQFELILRYPA